jgi:thiol-disulfide isomerase/thioredoxin
VTRCPDFSLVDLQGQTHHNSEWQGKVVVFNFWATWCPPCVREIPMFIELQKKYADRGLQFVGIATNDPPQVVAEFVEDNGINYPILIGEGDAIDVAVNFGNRFGALPYTAIVDREGNIVLRKVGEMKRQKLEKTILPLLSRMGNK